MYYIDEASILAFHFIFEEASARFWKYNKVQLLTQLANNTTPLIRPN